MALIDAIRNDAQRYLQETIENRREFHLRPELSGEEEGTAAFISKKLRAYGLEAESAGSGYGISALIGSGSPCVGLRADIDALPVQEESGLPFASRKPGVMHACGHDVHTACLLTAARILGEHAAQLPGSIRIIFQPAEERAPGGALDLISAGILDRPPVSAIFAQHVNTELQAGQIGFKPGFFMASVDEVYLTIRGRGGHGARPHLGVDAILTAAQIVIALQQINSRNADPLMPMVLTFGKIIGKGSTNVLPDRVEIAGTLRTVETGWRTEALERIRCIAEHTARAMGGECTVRVEKGYPPLYNHEEMTAAARQAAVEYAGNEMVQDIGAEMWSEDFSYYAEKIPACFYNLGVGNRQKGIDSPVHSASFTVDESALETGSGLLAWLAAAELVRRSRTPQS
jgi:amidohydrolase